MQKPFKGLIDNWYKVPVSLTSPTYGYKHLGFIVRGYPKGHPDFENWIQTSLVVWIDVHETCIETLNSRYNLGVKKGSMKNLLEAGKMYDDWIREGITVHKCVKGMTIDTCPYNPLLGCDCGAHKKG